MLKTSTFCRYFHTLRHLKPVQFYGRLGHRLHKIRLDTRPAPLGRPLASNGQWHLPAQIKASILNLETFHFLNETHTLSSASDWNNPKWEKLWLYNLHYFDDLNAEDAELRLPWHAELIERWIKENPAPRGNGWEPYPLSLRIVNWVKFFLRISANQPPKKHWLDSLALQARVLMQKLEHHLLGNHLFANAKALVFVGLYFQGAEAEKWLQTGLAILQREVPEQVLDDGGNFELSPMYHSIMLMDMLDLINISQCYSATTVQPFINGWQQYAENMVTWLQAMCHPDGDIAFFNDAVVGIAASLKTMSSYARSLGIATKSYSIQSSAKPQLLKLKHLKASGYVRLENKRAVAFLDLAKVGPDYIPGHAHADTLSFELSLFGHRVFVNSGTSCYGLGDERMRQRGTAAHNTVVIDDQNSSEVWSGFRVARRAYPGQPFFSLEPESHRVSCSHNGYRWLKGKPLHSREWALTARTFSIKDRITGKFQKAEARFHLHPDIRCAEREECLVLTLPGGHEVLVNNQSSKRRIEQTSWHPEFGLSIPNLCLIFEFVNSECVVKLDY
ncbi:heparinase II/III family protein [Endozoicomonas sp. ALC020]|uniref:heparinase II/III family protein n=1 Tax=unclassified Endozoicomonas TaxID=2644528 RepID=UPI003BAF3EEF